MAGGEIKAEEGVVTDGGINAGFSISAKWISAGFRICAGLFPGGALSAPDTQIRAEVRAGWIGCGEHTPPAANSDVTPPLSS
jgi:hypothetical protein